MEALVGPFWQRFYDALFKRVGSDQHVEIAGYLKDAEKRVLDKTAGEAVRDLWRDSPWSVESNLDLVQWPTSPVWYELPGFLRGVETGENPVMGFLVLPHPKGDGLYMVFTAFETSTIDPRHCFAVALLDAAAIMENAVGARRFYSQVPHECVERIMSQIGVSISPDFRDELMITEDDREEVIEAVMRDATADIPILLTIMAAESAENSFTIDMQESGNTLCSLPKGKRGVIGRVLDKLERRLSNGLVRQPRGRKRPKLFWYA